MNNNHYHNMARITDYGNQPFVANINKLAQENNYFRSALWTGEHLQLTLMSIPVGADIGAEMHQNVDQFLQITEGCAVVMMGQNKNALNHQKKVTGGFCVFVPAGTWHNIINTGNRPLKIYSIYAPPQHPFGTVHKTKSDAEHY